ncbi:MAG TPA: hypothetical protein DHV59_03440 [Oxalobacteraceae bacterium]|nr:hypothetical protein [Oxalobacteraceae bacterium]
MVTYLGLGMIIGVILALTGAGGGILAVPMLVFGAQLEITQAAPVGLLSVGMAALLGAGIALRSGAVRYRAALLIALAGALVSPFGAEIARATDTRWLSMLFALVLLFVAWRAFHHGSAAAKRRAAPARLPPCVRAEADGRFVWTSRCARTLAAAGAIAGLLSGVLGVGGGFVMVPALQRHTDLDMQSIVPTSLAVIALLSGAGVVTSAFAGHLDWMVAMPFAAGTLAGMMAGRLAASRLSGARLQKAFALAAAVVAAVMLTKAIA